jgi:hypothetical protein
VEKASALLLNEVHLLIIDLFPPGPRDPRGLHAAIWEDVAAMPYIAPQDKPLAGIAYEAAAGVRAYVHPFAVGDALPPVPLFLMPDEYITPPLDELYLSAFAGMPAHLRARLMTPGAGR